MQTLTNRLKPLLTGAVSLHDLDSHTKEALTIYTHFRASALCDLPPDQIKAAIDGMPEAARGMVTEEVKRLLKHHQA